MFEGFAYNLRHLRALSAIAECGSMSAAAAAIGLSQPALAQGLAKVEKQFDTRLFDRVADGMRLTAEGRLVLDRVEAARKRIAAAFRSLPRSRRRGFQPPENLITSTQIKALLSLAEGGSFLGAARATGTSQPALHRAVRELEAISAVPLAERRGQRVALSEHGAKLARAFRLAGAELLAARHDLAADEGEGRIAIGAMPLCRALLLPGAVSHMIRAFPSFRFDIAEGSYGELAEPLRDGRIDIMIGALRDPPPPDLDQQWLMTDRLVIAARTGHPIAATRGVGLDALAGYPWVIGRKGSPLRAHWEQLFAGREPPPAPIECGSVMTIRGILLDSDSLTLLSRDQIALELRAGLLVILAVDLPTPERRIGVISRAGWRPTRLQREFLDALTQSASAGKVPEIE